MAHVVLIHIEANFSVWISFVRYTCSYKAVELFILSMNMLLGHKRISHRNCTKKSH